MTASAPVPTRFMLLARYRSGSSFLRAILNAHPAILLHDELFNVDHLARHLEILDSPTRFLDSLWQPSRFRPLRAVGVTLMYEQASAAELDAAHWGPEAPLDIQRAVATINAYIAGHRSAALERLQAVWHQLREDGSLRVICLIRQDRLAAYVSYQLAMRENNWIGRSYATTRLRVDATDYDRWVTTGARLEEDYGTIFSDHARLYIAYEDLCDRLQPTLDRVFAFLEVPRIDVTPLTRKQQRRPLHEVVENYPELQRQDSDHRRRHTG